MLKPKYLIVAGYVTNPDGYRYYVSGPRLAHLYGLQPREYAIPRAGVNEADYIVLRPREDGNYKLPTC